MLLIFRHQLFLNVLIVAISVLLPCVWSADYVVGPSETYTTIQLGIDACTGPGDRVLIKGGVYILSVELQITAWAPAAVNGLSTNMIQLMPFGSDTVTIRTSGTALYQNAVGWWHIHSGGGRLIFETTAGTGNSDDFIIFHPGDASYGGKYGPFEVHCKGTYCAYPMFYIFHAYSDEMPDGLELTNIDFHGPSYYYPIEISTGYALTGGTKFSNGARIWIHDCKFYDIRSGAYGTQKPFLFTRGTYIVFENNYVEITGRVTGQVMNIKNNRYVTITNNIFHDKSTDEAHAMFFIDHDAASRQILSDFVIQNNLFWCENLPRTGTGGRRLIYYDSGDNPLYEVHRFYFQNNMIHKNCQHRYTIYCADSSNDFRDCYFRNNVYYGDAPMYEKSCGSGSTNQFPFTNFDRVDFELYGQGTVPDQYFVPTPVTGVNYAGTSPTKDFLGVSRTTFEMGPFAFKCSHSGYYPPTCATCREEFSGTNCATCAVENPQPFTCTKGKCLDDYSTDFCNYCDPATVAHPKDNTCKLGDCADQWTFDKCDYCSTTLIKNPKTGTCEYGVCSGVWSGTNCDVCVSVVHPAPNTCAANVCIYSWTGATCNDCTAIVNPASGTCEAGDCSDSWSGSTCSTCTAIVHPQTDTCKQNVCASPWTGTTCASCSSSYVVHPAPGTCELGNCADQYTTSDCSVCNSLIIHPQANTCKWGVCSDLWSGNECDSCTTIVNPLLGTCTYSSCAAGFYGNDCSCSEDCSAMYLRTCTSGVCVCTNGYLPENNCQPPEQPDETENTQHGDTLQNPSGDTSSGNNDETASSSTSGSSNAGAVVGTVLGLLFGGGSILLIIAIVVVVVIVIIKSRRNGGKSEMFVDEMVMNDQQNLPDSKPNVQGRVMMGSMNNVQNQMPMQTGNSGGIRQVHGYGAPKVPSSRPNQMPMQTGNSGGIRQAHGYGAPKVPSSRPNKTPTYY